MLYMSHWEEVNLTWEEFCTKGLNKSGTLIEVDSKQFLIGDVSEAGGSGSNNALFSSKDLVKKFRVIWK